MPEHLPLLYYEKEFTKRNTSQFVPRPKREDKIDFAEVQTYNLNEMQEEHQRKKIKYHDYLDPNLIFRIKLKSQISEKEFIQFLNRCDIQYISPSPTKNGGVSYRISLSETGDFQKIIEKINLYGRESRYEAPFDIIESFEPIPPDDKIGESLVERPLKDGEKAYLDIELWRMESQRLTDAITGIKKLIEAKGGELTDKIITNSLCLMRVRIDLETLNEILSLSEVSRVDRPPHISYFRQEELHIPLSEIDTGSLPEPTDPAIIVLDSGISSGHPLLENGIGDAIGVPPERGTIDEEGHGTKVAGVALYGDIKKCCDEKKFHPEVWILSAKVMYAKKDEETGEILTCYDDRLLIESQIYQAIHSLINRYDNIRVVNISFGDSTCCISKRKQQPPLASFIDELAQELNLIFVISAGNNITLDYFPDRYPYYLCDNTEDNNIIDPASSVYAITVGSITQDYVSQNLESRLVPHNGYPSPFTRTGPGLNGMIKPELVDIGGMCPYTTPYDYMMEKSQTGVYVLNPKWIEDSSLIATDWGTSFSSPKVANYLARLCKKYPQYTSNTIKAFLIASACIPEDRPKPLNIALFRSGSSTKELEAIDNIYGYGQPNLNYAKESNSQSVLLFSENKIKIRGIHYYYFYIPESFLKTEGERQISVTLVYNPPVRRTRMEYLGTKMQYMLYKNTDLKDIESRSLDEVLAESEEEDKGKIPTIELFPKKNARSKGIHQKGTWIFTRSPKIDASKPLVLEVLCSGTWIDDEDFTQEYSVVVTLRHSVQINLYNQMRERVMPRVRMR